MKLTKAQIKGKQEELGRAQAHDYPAHKRTPTRGMRPSTPGGRAVLPPDQHPPTPGGIPAPTPGGLQPRSRNNQNKKQRRKTMNETMEKAKLKFEVRAQKVD